ncbi:hypothetical protein A2U01_0110506, partial [Trifolium medium]|nr:hypothetical protein [Trifolium medium]
FVRRSSRCHCDLTGSESCYAESLVHEPFEPSTRRTGTVYKHSGHPSFFPDLKLNVVVVKVVVE